MAARPLRWRALIRFRCRDGRRPLPASRRWSRSRLSFPRDRPTHAVERTRRAHDRASDGPGRDHGPPDRGRIRCRPGQSGRAGGDYGGHARRRDWHAQRDRRVGRDLANRRRLRRGRRARRDDVLADDARAFRRTRHGAALRSHRPPESARGGFPARPANASRPVAATEGSRRRRSPSGRSFGSSTVRTRTGISPSATMQRSGPFQWRMWPAFTPGVLCRPSPR